MKNNVLIVAALLLIGSLIISCKKDEGVIVPCLTGSLQNQVIAFYDFNNGQLLDVADKTDDLQNSSTASSTTDRFGNDNCAFEFDNTLGKDEFLFLPNSAFLNNLTSFSISLWYQPKGSNRNVGDYEVLLSRGLEGRCPDRRGEWTLGLYDCRRAVFGHNNSVWADLVSNPFDSCEGEQAILTDVWHHAVAVKFNDNYKIYINGQLQEEEGGNANCNNLHLAEDFGDMIIGKYYTGKIDDILIYERALSANEVSDLFGLESCCQ